MVPARFGVWRCVTAAMGIVCLGPPTPDARQVPVFRGGTAIVSVDVIVRDRSGAVVRGLTANDFTVTENGRPQRIETFTFQEVVNEAPVEEVVGPLLGDVDARLAEELHRASGATTANQNAPPAPSQSLAGRRLLLLLFDLSSMNPEQVQRAVNSAVEYVGGQMAPADLVAVATMGSAFTLLTDFTSDRGTIRAALAHLALSDGTATAAVASSTAATDEAAATTDSAASDETGFDSFNNDVRLRVLRTLAETLAPIEQKKAILYFSAGLRRNGQDNQVELRAAINASVRSNVAIYPVDARGLEAVIPGGDAARGSASGLGLFSGQALERQLETMAASQETLTTLAAETGGRAFTDSNDFADAFVRAQRDLSAYYLIGYTSANPTRDGRFRRIQVRVGRRDVRVDARAGYYAERDYAHTSRRDKEAQLEDQLTAPVSATDLPLLVGAGWFRDTADAAYALIALAVPGSAVPVPDGAKNATLDIRGAVRDERGRTVGRIRDTLELPVTQRPLAGRHVLYQSGVSLPSGRFSVKVVVRENARGTIGSFEAPIVVPRVRNNRLTVSTVVMSTQLQPATVGRTRNPLIRDGVQLLPSLTRVITPDQPIYFYYEVYDAAMVDRMPTVRTSLAFYRRGVKVLETPLVERTTIDDPVREAVLFQFEVQASAFREGNYLCQVNIVDAIGAQAAFPRLNFTVSSR